MGKEHIVKQGEYLMRIARMYGFGDPLAIWNASENAELRKVRRSPDVLFPGDVLFIPEREVRDEEGATEQRHVFRGRGRTCKLRLVCKDVDDEPIAHSGCTLHVEGKAYQLVTDADGMIEQVIPSTAERGKLTINQVEVPIFIGHLDPENTPTGEQARLNNLGYYAGPLGKPEEKALRSARQEFQCDRELPLTDESDPPTADALRGAHGC